MEKGAVSVYSPRTRGENFLISLPVGRTLLLFDKSSSLRAETIREIRGWMRACWFIILVAIASTHFIQACRRKSIEAKHSDKLEPQTSHRFISKASWTNSVLLPSENTRQRRTKKRSRLSTDLFLSLCQSQKFKAADSFDSSTSQMSNRV